MNKGEQKKCNQCLLIFKNNNRPLRMPNCRHNVCEQCLQQIKESKIDTFNCQFCDSTAKVSKSKFDLNRILMTKLKQQVKKDMDKNAATRISTSGKQPEESDQNQFLLVGEDLDKQTSKSFQGTKQDICSVHDKPFEIVCVTDLKVICPHCAIFGGHKDHIFKNLKEFQKDFEERILKLQVIKEQKEINDRKVKQLRNKQNIQALLNNKKESLSKQISKAFNTLRKDLQDLQEGTYEDLNLTFLGIHSEIMGIFEKQTIVCSDFSKWESECDDLLSKANIFNSMSNKIEFLYGPLAKINEGEQIVDKLKKKIESQLKRVHSVIQSVAIESKIHIDFGNLINIVRKREQKQKQNKQTVVNRSSFLGLSFETSLNGDQPSIIVEAQTKRNSQKVMMTKQGMKASQGNQNFRSPGRKTKFQPSNQTTTIKRCKSNTDLNATNLRMNLSTSNIFESSLIKIQFRDTETIIAEYLKNELREMLDLSRCQLDDESAFKYLQQVRKIRKIRGLKINDNAISDKGLQKILDFLSSTTNLNISNNKLTQQSLSIMIKNRDKISPLRIVNLSGNNVNDKKGKTRLDALKKMGIMVNL